MNQSNICRLVVVEDEPPILNNIVQKINALELPLQITGTAGDGQSALALIEQTAPHIVLTDIRMPGMDGLELCRRLYEQYPAIRTVILSGYGEFEYAQTAIRYQVVDYLLKPVNPQKLRATLEKLCSEIYSSQQLKHRQLLLRQLSGTSGQELLPVGELRDASFSLWLICLGNLLDQGAPVGTPERCRQYWEMAALDFFMEEERPAFWQLIAEKNPNERMLLVVGAKAGLSERLFRFLRLRLAQTSCVNLCNAGRPVGYDEIWAAAREMRSTLRRVLSPCASSLFVSTALAAQINTAPLRQSMVEIVKSGGSTRFKSALHAWLDTMKTQSVPQQALETELLALLRMLDSQPNMSPLSKSIYRTCCQIIAAAGTADGMYQQLEQTLTEAYSQLCAQEIPAENLGAAVKAYLDEHYQEEITMESLSQQFHFSESYITRLFRTRFSIPPMKYLLWKRIEQAKELIVQNPGMGINTVAELVGYSDQHYFSRLFRISTGMSPSEYRATAQQKAL